MAKAPVLLFLIVLHNLVFRVNFQGENSVVLPIPPEPVIINVGELFLYSQFSSYYKSYSILFYITLQ